MKRWILLTFSILAVIALCLIIWFVFPVIAIAGVEPFGNLWLRLALIVLLIAVFFGLLALNIYRHRKSCRTTSVQAKNCLKSCIM